MNFRLFYFLRFFILPIFGYSQDVSDDTIATHHNFKNREDKIGDYVKCNVQLATVVYNSYSNVPKKNNIHITSSDEYIKASNKQNVTFNLGFNFLFGKSAYVKHVIGINYLRTKGEFYYSQGSVGYWSYSRYTSYVNFLNITSGLRFTFFKKLHLEPLVTINYVAGSKTTKTGTQTSYDWQTPPYNRHTSSFENQSTRALIEIAISLSPKISYEIPIKKIKMDAYIAYNFALHHRLPWYQFGFNIFPFKKLR